MGTKNSHTTHFSPQNSGFPYPQTDNTADETGLIHSLSLRKVTYRPALSDLHRAIIVENTPVPSPPWGLVGLRNLGNTCYLNAILQCLAHCPGLNNELCLPNPKSRLSISVSRLFQTMRSEQDFRVVEPREVKRAIGSLRPTFDGMGQQDAQELLRELLDGLSRELNRCSSVEPYTQLPTGSNYSKVAEEWFNYSRKREDSIITDYFRGQMLTLISSCNSRCKSVACDTFLDISLPVAHQSSPISLESCLFAFTKMTTVEDFYCEKHRKSGKSEVQMTLWRLPRIVVLHLKRFGRQGRVKIETPVKYPISGLNLREFGGSSQHESMESGVYDLVGVVHHVGGLKGGHYYA